MICSDGSIEGALVDQRWRRRPWRFLRLQLSVRHTMEGNKQGNRRTSKAGGTRIKGRRANARLSATPRASRTGRWKTELPLCSMPCGDKPTLLIGVVFPTGLLDLYREPVSRQDLTRSRRKGRAVRLHHVLSVRYVRTWMPNGRSSFPRCIAGAHGRFRPMTRLPIGRRNFAGREVAGPTRAQTGDRTMRGPYGSVINNNHFGALMPSRRRPMQLSLNHASLGSSPTSRAEGRPA